MKLEFDKNKPFYPFVMNYIVSVHGMLEIIARSAYEIVRLNKSKGVSLADLQIDQTEDSKQKEFLRHIYEGNLVPTLLFGDLSLRSEKLNEYIKYPIDELVKEVYINHPRILEFSKTSAQMLIISAYQITPEIISKNKSDELWNFMFHCRNASSHDGKFKIAPSKNAQERFPAKWHNFEIVNSMNGKPLFKNTLTDTDGLLSVGDALCLLHDIEIRYF
jgi:hypothetical protein